MTVLEFIKTLPNSSPRAGFESRVKVLVSSQSVYVPNTYDLKSGR